MPKQLDVQNFFKIWHIGYSNHKEMFKEIKNGGQKMYRLLFFVIRVNPVWLLVIIDFLFLIHSFQIQQLRLTLS